MRQTGLIRVHTRRDAVVIAGITTAKCMENDGVGGGRRGRTFASDQPLVEGQHGAPSVVHRLSHTRLALAVPKIG